MKIVLLLATLAAVISAGASWLLTSAEEPREATLSASAVCGHPAAGSGFEGRIEVVKGTPDDLTSDSAVIFDRAGLQYSTRGYGISGETMVIVPGRDPMTAGIELGEGRHQEMADEQLVECLISELALETRALTEEDVRELHLDPALVGVIADFETSISGVAWVVLSPLT